MCHTRNLEQTLVLGDNLILGTDVLNRKGVLVMNPEKKVMCTCAQARAGLLGYGRDSIGSGCSKQSVPAKGFCSWVAVECRSVSHSLSTCCRAQQLTAAECGACVLPAGRSENRGNDKVTKHINMPGYTCL